MYHGYYCCHWCSPSRTDCEYCSSRGLNSQTLSPASCRLWKEGRRERENEKDQVNNIKTPNIYRQSTATGHVIDSGDFLPKPTRERERHNILSGGADIIEVCASKLIAPTEVETAHEHILRINAKRHQHYTLGRWQKRRASYHSHWPAH